jgi:hypothetical protein
MRLSVIDRAEQAVLFLHDCDGAYSGTHAEMCTDLDWMNLDGTPDVNLFDRVRTCTLEQHHDPFAFARLQGNKISYSPGIGGVWLLDPFGQPTLKGLRIMSAGDALRERVHKTENERRVIMWSTVFDMFFNLGNAQGAQLANQIKVEIEQHGIISDEAIADWLYFVEHAGLEP